MARTAIYSRDLPPNCDQALELILNLGSCVDTRLLSTVAPSRPPACEDTGHFVYLLDLGTGTDARMTRTDLNRLFHWNTTGSARMASKVHYYKVEENEYVKVPSADQGNVSLHESTGMMPNSTRISLKLFHAEDMSTNQIKDYIIICYSYIPVAVQLFKSYGKSAIDNVKVTLNQKTTKNDLMVGVPKIQQVNCNGGPIQEQKLAPKVFPHRLQMIKSADAEVSALFETPTTRRKTPYSDDRTPRSSSFPTLMKRPLILKAPRNRNLAAAPLRVNLIVAMDEKDGIGRGNKIPWPMPKEIDHLSDFTKKTSVENKLNVVVMGRNCWDSIPVKSRPLPGRINVVLSRKMTPQKTENLIVSADFNEAMKLLRTDEYRNRVDTIWIIGGYKIYVHGLASPLLHKLVITRVHANFGADVFFPYVNWANFEKNDDFDGAEIEENVCKIPINIIARVAIPIHKRLRLQDSRVPSNGVDYFELLLPQLILAKMRCSNLSTSCSNLSTSLQSLSPLSLLGAGASPTMFRIRTRRTGWVTKELLAKCIYKNADFLVTNPSGGPRRRKRKLRYLKRPPTDRAAVVLETITHLPFLAARIRPPDEEDAMWEDRLNGRIPPDEAEQTHRQIRELVPPLRCDEDIGAHIDPRAAVEDDPEDVVCINKELTEEELEDVEGQLGAEDLRQLIIEERQSTEAAQLFLARENYIVDPRRRIINPFLYDEQGDRLRVPSSSGRGTVLSDENFTL
uniref:dihydrofolate reductase n=1 Tax=Steinernema glaseri TaxID=37863 RepID=A0A1I7Z047_9BILA